MPWEINIVVTNKIFLEKKIIELWEKPFRETCCEYNNNSYISLREYRNAFFNWILFVEKMEHYGVRNDMGQKSDMEQKIITNVHDIVQNHCPDNENKTIQLSAGIGDNRCIIGLSLSRFPNRILVDKFLVSTF